MMAFVWLRRVWQAFFLTLFLALIFLTSASLIGGWPVEWFLAIDPLAAIATALATHSLHHHLLWAVPLVVLTLVFGRFFCGWMCPMGVMHQALGWLRRPRRASARIAENAPRPSQKVKYAVLLVLLGASAAGSLQVGLLDPIALTWRSLSTTVIPAGSNAAFGLYQGERHFQYGVLITLVFLAALALNLVFSRFYCRVLCPLGGLLGLLSRFSLFRIHKDAKACTDCGKCGADCHGAADPQGTVRTAECMVCLNCTTGCPENAIAYRFLPPESGQIVQIDLSRRRWVGAVMGGVVAMPLMRASDAVAPRPHPQRIRPPGALDETEFLERCLKCGACMKICPTGGLQPALMEGGFEGLWTPVLVPRIGPCEQTCTLCSHVCPTGAIRAITPQERVGKMPEVEPLRIGSAAVDRNRCLPWAYDRECIVCEEVCPTSPKAVFFKEEAVVLRDGSRRVLKRPYVDLDQCTGCGTCEARCPVFDQAGIRVTSVGETRSPTNRILLSGRV